MIMNDHEFDRIHTAQFKMTEKLSKLDDHASTFDHLFYKGYAAATPFHEATTKAKKFVTWELPRIDKSRRSPDPKMYTLGDMIESIWKSPPSIYTIPKSQDLQAINAALKKEQKGTWLEWGTEPQRQAWIEELNKKRDAIIKLTDECNRLKNDLIADWTKVTNFKWTVTLGKFGAFTKAHLQDPISLQTPCTLTEMRLLLPQC